VAHDYARMVALSHPQLRPEVGAAEIKRYSQHFVDLIDLAANEFETRPVSEVLSMDFPSARQLVSVDRKDYLELPLAYDPNIASRELVLTFENLLTRTQFVPMMRTMLRALSERFGRHVDMEFTVDIVPGYPQPDFVLHLLQCRPQAGSESVEAIHVPATISESDVLFTADRLIPHGLVRRIDHIVFVDPEVYARIRDETTRLQIARVVGQLNQVLAEKSFILMGPGRWGSNNVELGVKVTYADIFNTAMLIEIGLSDGDSAPEASYGTHFFQDLVEARIYPLALFPGQGETIFNWHFFRSAPNALATLLPDAAEYGRYVRVIDIPAATRGQYLEVVMDDEKSRAMAYLRYYSGSRDG
jgi:pyruvate,water dikinase